MNFSSPFIKKSIVTYSLSFFVFCVLFLFTIISGSFVFEPALSRFENATDLSLEETSSTIYISATPANKNVLTSKNNELALFRQKWYYSCYAERYFSSEEGVAFTLGGQSFSIGLLESSPTGEEQVVIQGFLPVSSNGAGWSKLTLMADALYLPRNFASVVSKAAGCNDVDKLIGENVTISFHGVELGISCQIAGVYDENKSTAGEAIVSTFGISTCLASPSLFLSLAAENPRLMCAFRFPQAGNAASFKISRHQFFETFDAVFKDSHVFTYDFAMNKDQAIRNTFQENDKLSTKYTTTGKTLGLALPICLHLLLALTIVLREKKSGFCVSNLPLCFVYLASVLFSAEFAAIIERGLPKNSLFSFLLYPSNAIFYMIFVFFWLFFLFFNWIFFRKYQRKNQIIKATSEARAL